MSKDQAIRKTKGPCVILAGAGTGKTHTIVEKIKSIINRKIYSPEKIVCLTFSNEAANSLKERVYTTTESENQPIIKTFHSFCTELLKNHGEKIGVEKNFRILLPDDAKIMLHKNLRLAPTYCHKYVSTIGIAKDLGLSPENLEIYLKEKNIPDIEFLEKSLENLRFRIQTSQLSKPEKLALKRESERLEISIQRKKFLQTWKAYEKLKEKRGFQDYSDLNKNALALLKRFPDISKEFDYIIVDEFQDTNKLQCDFLEILAPHKNITVVGDMNQSIYRFRGAYKNNFSNFKNSFNVKKDEIFTLDKSFRSTNLILETAHKLIENNYENKEECFKVLNHQNLKGEKPEVYELKNSKEEARKIIEIIEEESSNGIPLNDICVISRTHQQARIIKNALENKGIEFTSITTKNLTKTPPIKTTLNYLIILDKLKNNSRGGEQAWWDLLFNSSLSKEDKIELTRFIKKNKEEECLSRRIIENSSEIGLTAQGKEKIKHLTSKIKTLLNEIEKPVPELILKIYEAENLASKENPEYKENVPILEKFRSLAQEYTEIDSPELESFLHHMNILNSLGIEIESPKSENQGVRIMTNHSTKGLEYELVIVTNLAQGRFPIEARENSLLPAEISPEVADEISSMDEEEKERFLKENEKTNNLLEERRLCYVSFTRAKKRLILTYAKQYGQRNYYPSQFLAEIDYQKNPNMAFIKDLEEKYQEPKKTALGENNIQTVLSANNPEELINEAEIPKIRFSPSALQTFNDCQKRYEYKYVYNMPDPEPTSWDAIKLGSFIHKVLETGVSSNYKNEHEFIELAKTLQTEEEWNYIDLKEVYPMIKVFFHRNKNKYSEKSLTEQMLLAKIEGLDFIGFADRIDFHPDGIGIVDYKTGNSFVKPKYRNWQLGFYALAAEKFGKPRRLTLDMLRKEDPIEFVIDTSGNAKEIHSQRTSFNLNEIKQELIETANKILECYKKGFKPCPPENNCPFCNELIWDS